MDDPGMSAEVASVSSELESEMAEMRAELVAAIARWQLTIQATAIGAMIGLPLLILVVASFAR